jgi:hypothetical protein
MSTETKVAIAFSLASSRLVFRMGRTLLIVNPRGCAGDASGKTWPHCQTFPVGNHACREESHAGESKIVPARCVIDNQYGCADSDSPWFAFWQGDCMDPPVWIVRATSFEAAYGDFCDEIQPIDQASLPDYLNAAGEYEGHYNSRGEPIDTESINGCEIELISASNEREG